MNARWVMGPVLFAAAACAAGDRDGNAQRSSSRAEGDDGGVTSVLPASCVRMMDIKTFAGAEFAGAQVTDLNERGEVVGWMLNAGVESAFYWNGSQLVDLGPNTRAFSINERSEIAFTRDGKTYIWRNGTAHELDGVGGTSYINDQGDVVGLELPVEYGTHAALWRNGATTDLGVINGDFSTPVGLNERGQVLVSSGNDAPVEHASFHPFIWENGTVTDVNPPEFPASYAVALNESGSALLNAFAAYDSGFLNQAVLWTGGAAVTVTVPGMTYVRGVALNDHDAVLGAAIAFLEDHAEGHSILWQNGQSTIITGPGVTPDDPGDPVAVNNDNVVAMRVGAHAFAWKNGASVALEGGTVQRAQAMNEHGLIAGTIDTGTNAQTARIWDVSRCFEGGSVGGFDAGTDAGSNTGEDAGVTPTDAGGGGKAW